MAAGRPTLRVRDAAPMPARRPAATKLPVAEKHTTATTCVPPEAETRRARRLHGRGGASREAASPTSLFLSAICYATSSGRPGPLRIIEMSRYVLVSVFALTIAAAGCGGN